MSTAALARKVNGTPVTLADLVGLHVLEAYGTYHVGMRAEDWIVNDIRIGGRSQLAASGDLPGDMFASGAIDAFVNFETAQVAMDVQMTVTNISHEAATFHGSFIGVFVGGADEQPRQSRGRAVLPMHSGVAIPPGHSAQITARPQNATFRPERLMIAGAKENHVLLVLHGDMYDFSSYGGISKIEDEATRDAHLETILPVGTGIAEPDLIYLRLHNDTLLYGVSERTGLVVFEAGAITRRVPDADLLEEEEEALDQDGIAYDMDRVYGPRAPRIVTDRFLRFDHEGFVPTWLTT